MRPPSDDSGGLGRLYAALEALELLSAGSGDERRDTRERILSAALQLFAVEGVQATSMRQLAAAVGIKAPGLYSHFESKEAILTAAIARALRSFLAFVALPYGLDPAEARLEGLVRRHVRFQLENFELATSNDSLLASRSSLLMISEEARSVLRAGQRAYLDLLRREIALRVHRDDPARTGLVLAFSVLSICDRVNAWYHPQGSMSATDVEDAIWDVVDNLLRRS